MRSLPHNPGTGETIVKLFCRMFSSMIEDKRRSRDHSYPMQGMFKGDKPIEASVFNHSVLLFLHGYMKFENNFVSFYERKT